jgi:hypothetical protein
LAQVPEHPVVEHLAADCLVRVLDDGCQPFSGHYLYYPNLHQPSLEPATLVEALRHRAMPAPAAQPHNAGVDWRAPQFEDGQNGSIVLFYSHVAIATSLMDLRDHSDAASAADTIVSQTQIFGRRMLAPRWFAGEILPAE